jgi:hypothetical protein
MPRSDDPLRWKVGYIHTIHKKRIIATRHPPRDAVARNRTNKMLDKRIATNDNEIVLLNVRAVLS